jgi:hypothetical protein
LIRRAANFARMKGTIDLDIPFDPATRFELTLNNLRSYVSGNGKNRSRKEEAKWQDTIAAHAEQGIRGTRSAFRFDSPEGLDASDADQGESCWESRSVENSVLSRASSVSRKKAR